MFTFLKTKKSLTNLKILLMIRDIYEKVFPVMMISAIVNPIESTMITASTRLNVSLKYPYRIEHNMIKTTMELQLNRTIFLRVTVNESA